MKKRILTIGLIIINILIILVSAIVLYEKHLKKNNVNSLKNSIPKDNILEDNKELYGTWVGTNLELYENGNLKITLVNQVDKELQIYGDNDLSVCHYIEFEDSVCVNTKYSYINNKLYIEDDEDTYLASVSEISFNETEMLVKAINGANNYSILYFKRK